MPTYEESHQMPNAPQTSGPQAAQDKYAATAWGGEGVDLEMPSGQLAYVRKPGMEALVAGGVINSLDSLAGIVDGLLDKAEGKATRKVDMSKLLEDPSTFENLLHTVDRVVVHTVLKPEVHMTPNDVTSRKPGVIYCDMIDLEDRFFIFNYVAGGPTSVEEFRKQSEKSVADMVDVAEDELSAL